MTEDDKGLGAGPLTAVLQGHRPPAVLHWPDGLVLGPALAAARAAGWTTAVLDLAGVADKTAFMRRSSVALHLPDWFGHNWDALADCLRDPSWLPADGGRVLAVCSWLPYAKARPAEWDVVQEVLDAAVDFWRGTRTPLVVVVADSGS
ncbi:barstar family protein [Streptomyces sp. NPDC006879]|uniref:barstar family protein n=1 Tax=Streptomyces sp. NPDC006879 TaxID=3364767 RepID=UPI0036D1FC9D